MKSLRPECTAEAAFLGLPLNEGPPSLPECLPLVKQVYDVSSLSFPRQFLKCTFYRLFSMKQHSLAGLKARAPFYETIVPPYFQGSIRVPRKIATRALLSW